MEVQVEETDIFTMVGKGKREIYRNGGFSHTALPAQHEDDVFYINLRFGGQSLWNTFWSTLLLYLEQVEQFSSQFCWVVVWFDVMIVSGIA